MDRMDNLKETRVETNPFSGNASDDRSYMTACLSDSCRSRLHFCPHDHINQEHDIDSAIRRAQSLAKRSPCTPVTDSYIPFDPSDPETWERKKNAGTRRKSKSSPLAEEEKTCFIFYVSDDQEQEDDAKNKNTIIHETKEDFQMDGGQSVNEEDHISPQQELANLRRRQQEGKNIKAQERKTRRSQVLDAALINSHHDMEAPEFAFTRMLKEGDDLKTEYKREISRCQRRSSAPMTSTYGIEKQEVDCQRFDTEKINLDCEGRRGRRRSSAIQRYSTSVLESTSAHRSTKDKMKHSVSPRGQKTRTSLSPRNKETLHRTPSEKVFNSVFLELQAMVDSKAETTAVRYRSVSISKRKPEAYGFNSVLNELKAKTKRKMSKSAGLPENTESSHRETSNTSCDDVFRELQAMSRLKAEDIAFRTSQLTTAKNTSESLGFHSVLKELEARAQRRAKAASALSKDISETLFKSVLSELQDTVDDRGKTKKRMKKKTSRRRIEDVDQLPKKAFCKSFARSNLTVSTDSMSCSECPLAA